MIRILQENDLGVVMQIWLDTNIDAHGFISREYWISNYATVEKMLPHAEIYVYENDDTEQIEGFIGVTDHYIAGIFVKAESQSKGIGKQLLDYVKGRKEELNLSVYQKNVRAVRFYQREQFFIRSENIEKETNETEYRMIWHK
ncbi:putative N-acetyltransferase YjaB [Lachnospiraceae bacterium]|nr:putative N-acetyltransferase YjaB [Lachnospiraceae bacterium]